LYYDAQIHKHQVNWSYYRWI